MHALGSIEHLEGVVAKCRDEEPLPLRVERQVIDASGDVRQRNRGNRTQR